MEFLKINDIQQQLQSQLDFEKKPNSREYTYILFANKPPGIDKFEVTSTHMPILAVLMGIFKRKNEKWLMFNSGTLEYPTDELLDNARAIIIPGSRASAYDDADWIK